MVLYTFLCVLCKYALCSNSQIISCEISDLASFVSNEPGYILHQNVSLNNDFKLSLKFKTLAPNGMIFYVTNRAQTAAVSLALVESALVLISQKYELKVPLLTKYNDGKWHVVSVIYSEKQPSLEIDDWEAFTIESLSAPLPLHIVNGDLFIGGFRDDYKPPNGTINITTPFAGCIADIILNNKTIHFAEAAKRFNVVMDHCASNDYDHQCNGHSDKYDVETGECLDCQHNTHGVHCDHCAVGHIGNALQGTTMDCLNCACPLPVASNNFATGCQVSSDGDQISCDCLPGYYGARCESCAAGYYGRPEVLGEQCAPCSCSGNINPAEPGACDSVTGECLRCLNNTFGEACAWCAPGYYGDAIILKDCQTCACDPLGTEYCDSYSGRCECLLNVVGEKCDTCLENHYGFTSGQGCRACECAPASESAQCDDASGQCRCRGGVTGRTCDRCAAGFWDYTPQGCVSCGCNTNFSLGLGCNARTGQCECLPGVIGEKCEVFIEEHEVTEEPTPLPTQPPEIITTPPELDGEVGWIPKGSEAPSDERCALPMEPAESANIEAGWRFGTRLASRLEFPQSRGRLYFQTLNSQYRQYKFIIHFRTTAEDGLIFYVADSKHMHFVALYLVKGKLKYVFNCGVGPVLLESEQKYDDGLWHRAVFSRNLTADKLMVDERLVGSKHSGLRSSRHLNITPPYYLGAVPSDFHIDVQLNLKTYSQFVGCLRNFQMNGKPMQNPQILDAQPCSDTTETGMYFGAAGGYLKLKERFKVGVMIDIQMDIKPRNVSGLIMFVQGKRDFLVLQMVDGVIKFTVDNGKGPIEAAFNPPTKHYFCDGRWHNIQAIKYRNVVSLAVDKTFADAGKGESHSTDTKFGLFLGGHAHLSTKRLRGVQSRSSFVGCIRDVQINNEKTPISLEMAGGDVSVGVCPTN